MLILASKSKSRTELLSSAGVEFKAIPANIDEDSLKKDLFSQNKTTSEASLSLGIQKALVISKKYPKAYVIGADQILELRNVWFSKPEDISQARTHLRKLRKKMHSLVNGIAVLKNSQILWSCNSTVSVTMRDFSDDFLEYYLEKAGEEICDSVGAYYFEELGAQLIEKIEGDYFSVLGLPLLPLLNFLRSCGELKS